MHPTPKLLCLLALAALPSVGCRSMSAGDDHPVWATYGADQDRSVQERIRRVEHGLLPGSMIVGDPVPTMNLIERMKALNVPGLSIAVINNNRIEWARAYGVRVPGSNEPVTVDTMFQAASISKPLVAAAAMRLVEQGKLSLDEDINKKLKSWKVPENEFTRNSKVTLRRILTHTAGFRIMQYSGTPVNEPLPTTLDLLESRYSNVVDGPIRVVYEPGTKSEYSGAGFIVLQKLLEDVTGKSFPRLMNDLVFRPVGMTNSTFEQLPSPELKARMAAGTERGKPVEGGWLLKPNMASGGVWTTATDLAKFLIELQKANAGKPNKLLKPAMARQMLQPHEMPVEPGQRAIFGGARGLGLEVGGEGDPVRFGHGGNNTGYRSDMIALPDGRGLVLLINGSGQGLLREITRAVAIEYGWPIPEYLPIQRKVVSVPESVLQRYMGRYEWPEGHNPRIDSVAVEGGRLMMEGRAVRAESETRFFGEGGQTYTFMLDSAGAVEGFRFEVPGLTLVAKKLPD